MKQNYFEGRGETRVVRVSLYSYNAVKRLSKKKGLKQITTLEYLLRGLINIDELDYEL